MKGKKYSMTKSRVKSLGATIIALVLTVTSVISVSAAQSPEYSASSSYKSSTYYKNLKNVVLTGDQVTDICNVAKSQVGYHESSTSGDYSGYSSGSGNVTEYGRWFGNQSYWCNVFVSWCANVAGIPQNVFPKLYGVGDSYYGCLASVGAERFQFSSSRALEAGDLIFCCTCSGSRGCIDHVGLVVEVKNGTIYTVEGNMSDEVSAYTYSAYSGISPYGESRINYVARPNYENNIKVAPEIEEANGVLVLDGKVYARFDIPVTYSIAKELCAEMGGKLLSAGEDFDTEALLPLLEDGALSRYFVENTEGTGTAKAMNKNGKIFTTTQSRRATGFICEIDATALKSSNAASFNGSKYEIYDGAITFEQAQAVAEAKGGTLAVIDSQNKAMMLSLLLKESDCYYTATPADGEDAQTEINVLLNNRKGEVQSLDQWAEEQKIGFIVEYSDTEKHTVVYDANGGESAPIEKVADCGKTVKVTDITPVKGNKVFLGWSFSPKAKDVDIVSGQRFRLEKDIVLYAVWG